MFSRVLSLYESLFKGKDEIPRHLIEPLVKIKHLEVFTILSDGELAGAVFMCKNSLEYLFVSPTIRSNGIGGMLLRAILSKLRRSNTSSLLLECQPHLVGYYKKFGAYLLGTQKIFNDGEIYLQMRIDIK